MNPPAGAIKIGATQVQGGTEGQCLKTVSGKLGQGACGGGGGVTSVATGPGLTGGPIVATGTISAQELVNAQSGASYAIVTGDWGKAVVGTNAGVQAYSIAQAGSAGFPAGFFVDVRSAGAGTITITPATSTINGAATLALTSGQSARIISDGTNYIALLGAGAAASSVQSVSVTLSTGDIEALNVTPVQIVAAPGAGNYIGIVGVSAFYDYSGTPFTDYTGGFAPKLVLKFGSGGYSVLESDTDNAIGLSVDYLLLFALASSIAPGPILNTELLLTLDGLGRIATSALNDGGLGYAMGDTFDIDGTDATGVVDTVGALGVVLTYSIVARGTGIEPVTDFTTTATTGIGTGLTIDIPTVQSFAGGNGTIKVTMQYQTITVP